MYFYETIKRWSALIYGNVKACTVASRWSLQWCALNTAYDKNKRRLSKEFSLCFQDGYDQFALKMTTCVARSKEPFLTKVQFVAIIIRILDVIKYGHFL